MINLDGWERAADDLTSVAAKDGSPRLMPVFVLRKGHRERRALIHESIGRNQGRIDMVLENMASWGHDEPGPGFQVMFLWADKIMVTDDEMLTNRVVGMVVDAKGYVEGIQIIGEIR